MWDLHFTYLITCCLLSHGWWRATSLSLIFPFSFLLSIIQNWWGKKKKRNYGYTSVIWLQISTAASEIWDLLFTCVSSELGAFGARLLRARSKESHSRHQERREDTSGCSLGIGAVIFFPPEKASASGRLKGGHPFCNLSFVSRSSIWHEFSSLLVSSPALASWVDILLDMLHSWLAQLHCRRHRRSSIAHRCKRSLDQI